MKDKNQISIKHIIPFFLITAFFLIANVMLRKEIKFLTKYSNDKAKFLGIQNEKIEDLNIQVQKLSSEERIVDMAQTSLGLVRPAKELEVIPIVHGQIKQLENIVNGKYE